MRVADWLMQAIVNAGVRHVFMVPGGGAMHLNDALALNKDLMAVHCFGEQSCGIAAEAYGRLTENIGVVMVTSGPGATNVLTPVVGAWIESSPLLVISGQVKRADMKGDMQVRQKGPQEVDVISMVRSVTKYAETVTDPARIEEHFYEAILVATSRRPGPVWLEVPLDVQAAEI